MATFIGSFMMNFWAFLFFRALVGIGEASYSTIAPAIISDLFTKDTRSRVLALFYFAIPVGTGLGYIIGKILNCGGPCSHYLIFIPILQLKTYFATDWAREISILRFLFY